MHKEYNTLGLVDDSNKVKENSDLSQIVNDYQFDKKVETDRGLTKRIIDTLEKHWGGKNLPLVHFTNDEVNWGVGSKIKSTGFVESIKKEGLKKFSNVGFIPPEKFIPDIKQRFQDRNIKLDFTTDEEAKRNPLKFLKAVDKLRKEFVHHGLRANKNKVHGTLSIPAVVIFEADNTFIQQGDDRPEHAQVNKKIPSEKIIGIFQFDPNDMIRQYMTEGINPPAQQGKKDIPFQKELTSDNRKIRNQFLKLFLHKLGQFKLKELFALYNSISDNLTREKILLGAHELVDIYLVKPEEFDELFVVNDEKVKEIIKERRNNIKYILERWQSGLMRQS